MYHLQVITPEEVVYDEKVLSIIVPGALGYLGIMTNHVPLISTLQPGICIITDQNHKKHFYKVEGGFLEVNRNEISILVDAIAPTDPVNFTTGV